MPVGTETARSSAAAKTKAAAKPPRPVPSIKKPPEKPLPAPAKPASKRPAAATTSTALSPRPAAPAPASEAPTSAPHSARDSPPQRPPYLVPGNAAAEEQSAVHFSVKRGEFVSTLHADDPLDALDEPLVPRQLHPDAAPARSASAEPPLRNGLSCINRAVQTSHWPSKDRATSPPRQAFAEASGSCSAWEIHDAYTAQAAAQDPTVPAPSPSRPASYVERVMRRMIFQNLHHVVSTDFKYWDDPADEKRPEEGTLLPLWYFQPASKGRAVTALAWNPKHHDLFAAGYGSFDPGRPVTGMVSCHALTDADHPECTVALPASVLSLDFHVALPSLLAVGCMDGSVHVINVSHTAERALLASSPVAARHGDPVWQVRWAPPPRGQSSSFWAASSGGKLVRWELGQGDELRRRDSVKLRGGSSSGAAAPPPRGFPAPEAAASAFDPHPGAQSLLVVGTQEGDVLRCSLDGGLESSDVYSGHAGPVYTVQWSPLHPAAFLSASADWTVRIWQASTPGQEALVFDAGAPVGDADWAPYSSTVFAAITDTGRVLVYDLAHSTDWPMCKQKVAQKLRLTKLAFSPIHPVILVGDEKGGVTCFKLSPNLRRSPQLPNGPGGGRGRSGSGRAASAERGPSGGASEEENKDDSARKLAALQRKQLQGVLQIAAAGRAAEAAWDSTQTSNGAAQLPPTKC